MVLFFLLSGCCNNPGRDYVIVDSQYQLISEKSLFEDKIDLMVTKISLSDHHGLTHYPDIKVSLSKSSDHNDVAVIKVYVDEPLLIERLNFNADGEIYQIAHRSMEDGSAVEYGYGEFIVSRPLLKKITFAKNTTVQVDTNNGVIEKVLSKGNSTIAQEAFKSFLREAEVEK